MADSLSTLLLVAGAGLAGYAILELVKRPDGDDGEDPHDTVSIWSKGDVLELHSNGNSAVITIVKVPSPGNYRYWSGYYGSSADPVTDSTQYEIAQELLLTNFTPTVLDHVELPAGVAARPSDSDEEWRRNLGPGGQCICPSCGAVVQHLTGTPCAETSCPECGGLMIREG
jgi:hypothetical protein